jgi:hypothetical protein
MEQVHVVAAAQQLLGDRGGEHRVVGERAARDEQREVLRLGALALVDRADHVADDRTEHGLAPQCVRVPP